MKSLIIAFCVLCVFVLASKAQNKVDKAINNANNSLNSTNNSVNGASATGTAAVGTATNAVTQTKNIAGQLGGLFGKKKKASDDVVITTEITIQSCSSYSALRKLNECIRGFSVVQDSKPKFNSTEPATIMVTHSGSTDQLFSLISKKLPDCTRDENIAGSEEGKIILKKL